jgi:hypothetical protein
MLRIRPLSLNRRLYAAGDHDTHRTRQEGIRLVDTSMHIQQISFYLCDNFIRQIRLTWSRKFDSAFGPRVLLLSILATIPLVMNPPPHLRVSRQDGCACVQTGLAGWSQKLVPVQRSIETDSANSMVTIKLSVRRVSTAPLCVRRSPPITRFPGFTFAVRPGRQYFRKVSSRWRSSYSVEFLQ